MYECVHRRFDRLNPYNKRLIKHLLKVEDDNFNDEGLQRQLWCYVISAKRYCLYNANRSGQPTLLSVSDAGGVNAQDEETSSEEACVVKRSEHGLGHLLSPNDPDAQEHDWIRQAWEWILATHHNPDAPPPAWSELPAVSQTSISTPGGVNAFRDINRGKPYADQIKPFNFLLTCYPDPIYGKPDDTFRLVAPYERDPARWIHLAWYDAHTRKRYRITTTGTGSADVIRVRSYGDILDEYRTHPETKAAGPDSQPCGKRTRGILQRRGVAQSSRLNYVGKESTSSTNAHAKRSGPRETI